MSNFIISFIAALNIQNSRDNYRKRKQEFPIEDPIKRYKRLTRPIKDGNRDTLRSKDV